MFKKPWYRIALNVSLNELGIPTIRLNPAFRDEVIELAVVHTLTPHEGALLVYSRVSAQMNSLVRLSALETIRQWRVGPDVREEVYQRIFAEAHRGQNAFVTTNLPLRD